MVYELWLWFGSVLSLVKASICFNGGLQRETSSIRVTWWGMQVLNIGVLKTRLRWGNGLSRGGIDCLADMI